MIDLYDGLGEIMGDLESALMEIEMMLLNGRCVSGNRYLMNAEQFLRRALAELSDAEFEIYTSPTDEIYEPEDGEFDDLEINVDTL